jgi:hypothetical protein
MDKVYELISLLPEEICSKLRLYLETPSAKIIRDYEKEPKPWVNRCVECGVDMGDCNPRQFCGKWRCYDAEY